MNNPPRLFQEPGLDELAPAVVELLECERRRLAAEDTVARLLAPGEVSIVGRNVVTRTVDGRIEIRLAKIVVWPLPPLDCPLPKAIAPERATLPAAVAPMESVAWPGNVSMR